MDLTQFGSQSPGELALISGNDPRFAQWEHRAFVPFPLPEESPELSGATYRSVAEARASVAALDAIAARLPNPRIFRQPALRQEAQSTSALEGTFEPLQKVLTADEDAPASESMREVLNYVTVAEEAFEAAANGQRLTPGRIASMQRQLLTGTRSEYLANGDVRDSQVVIGKVESGAPGVHPVKTSRFVPPPPGQGLKSAFSDLLEWINSGNRTEIDPIVATAMGHYQFESLHPFRDGNGRLGRLLIVVQLVMTGVLSEPTLTVSPWFESRRPEYYDRLFSVSSEGDWDSWVRFFARGLGDSADLTRRQMLALAAVQEQLHEQVGKSSLRARSTAVLVDYAASRATFTVRQAEAAIALTYSRAFQLVKQLVKLGVLEDLPGTYPQRYFSPAVLDVLLGGIA